METSQSYISVLLESFSSHMSHVNHHFHRIKLPNSSMTDAVLGNQQCYTVCEAMREFILSLCNTQTLGLTLRAMIQHLLTSVCIVADGSH